MKSPTPNREQEYVAEIKELLTERDKKVFKQGQLSERKDIDKIILWARQWAEYCDDKQVLDMWERKVCPIRNYGETEFQFDVTKLQQIQGGKE